MNVKEKLTWDTWNLKDVLQVGNGFWFYPLTKINYI